MQMCMHTHTHMGNYWQLVSYKQESASSPWKKGSQERLRERQSLTESYDMNRRLPGKTAPRCPGKKGV